MKNKYILGSGISSLIFKYYNSDFEIISPDTKIGGQLTINPRLLTTFYIHSTEETKCLLKDLGVNYKEKRLKIYYYYYGKLLENATHEERLNIIKNKLQECDYDSNSHEIKNTILSVSNNYLDILDCDVLEVIKKLTPKKTICGDVKLINNNRKFMTYKDDSDKLVHTHYDTIISTIPANRFFNLTYNYKCDYYLNYLPATYVASKNKPSFVTDEDAIYYVADDKLIYNRVQKMGDSYIYEITGFVSPDLVKRQIGDYTDIEERYVGLIKDEDVKNFRYIKFLGRNAQWKSNIKIQDVIKYSKEYRNENKTR